MRPASKILVLAASAVVAASSASAQLVKHDAGRTYEQIAECLKGLTMEEGRHFRKKPGTDGVIQLNKGAVLDDFMSTKAVTKAEIDGCWKAPADKAAKKK